MNDYPALRPVDVYANGAAAAAVPQRVEPPPAARRGFFGWWRGRRERRLLLKVRALQAKVDVLTMERDGLIEVNDYMRRWLEAATAATQLKMITSERDMAIERSKRQ